MIGVDIVFRLCYNTDLIKKGFKMQVVRLNINLPDSLVEFLARVKEETGEAKPSAIRRALFLYKKQYEAEKAK